MGFNSVDDIYQGSKIGRVQVIHFGRQLPSATVAFVPHSWFRANGYPYMAGTAGLNPSGAFTAEILSQSHSGAISFRRSGTGMTQHIVGFTVTPSSNAGTMFLVDRIAHCQLSHSSTNGNIIGMSAVDRLEQVGRPGSGAQIWCEVSDLFSADACQFYFTYTNQDGTSGRVTPTIVTAPSAAFGRTILPNTGAFISLQQPDVGVRSIESITMVSGSSTATGKYNVCLVVVKAAASFNQGAVGPMNHDFDYVTQQVCPEIIHDDAYLSLISWNSAGAAYTTMGLIKLATG